MSLKIDLGLESKSHKVDNNVDPMDALLGYTAAREAMVRGEAEIATLNTAMATIERGEEFKQAIISQTGNTELAITTAQESLRRALVITGNDAIADQIVAGTESIDGITSANENMLKNMADKAKEYAKKVWEWIRNLVNKAIDFVKGIFGKGGATYDELLDLLKKAEKEKRTNLEDDKFPEATAKTLAGKVPVVLMNDSDVDSDRMTSFLDTMSGLLTKNTVLGKFDSVSYVDDDIVTQSKVGDIEILGNLLSNSTKENVGSNLSTNFNDLKDDILEKVGDYDKVYVEVFGATPKKIIAVALVVKEDANTAYGELEGLTNDDSGIVKAKSALNKIRNNIEIKTVELTPNDPKGDFERIIPIEYNDAKTVAEKMKESGKKAEKESSKFQKDVDKKAKAFEKSFKDNGNSKYLYQIHHKVISGFYKAAASAYSTTLIGLARNEFGDIIKESVRLYKKA